MRLVVGMALMRQTMGQKTTPKHQSATMKKTTLSARSLQSLVKISRSLCILGTSLKRFQEAIAR